jgi:catechol 2,3-dioxygenase-like lactoylglutathione lyase family enzyme
MAERIGYLDHISLAVPNVPAQVDFFTHVMGMTAVRRGDDFGLVRIPNQASGSRSPGRRAPGRNCCTSGFRSAMSKKHMTR